MLKGVSEARWLKRAIIGARYWIAGHMIAKRYDKKYLRGRWFQGKMNGLCSTGWRWVVEDYYACKQTGINRGVKWPVSPWIRIVCPENIVFHPDDLNNFQGMGNYFQALGRIEIGRGTYIAPNVGIITSNHNIRNLDLHDEAREVKLGERCWIGMNSVILPGVILGNEVIVGAGSVVTKSFPEDRCVVAGNPAKIIRRFNAKE